jgi:hypothetical protein
LAVATIPAHPQRLAVRGRVVATIGDQLLGRRRGRPGRPRTGGICSISGSSWVTSLRLAAVTRTARGIQA